MFGQVCSNGYVVSVMFGQLSSEKNSASNLDHFEMIPTTNSTL